VRRSNDYSLKEAIQEFLNTYRLEGKLEERKVIESWGSVMGKMVSNHTTDIYIRNKKLYVKVDSAALRSELSYAREKIRDVLNKEVNSEVITDVIIR
jgi:predicted nucleic acid-binding Zn ribbon protein